MKSKVILIAIAAWTLTTACASNCGNNQWRKRRFVETEKPVELPQTSTVKVAAA